MFSHKYPSLIRAGEHNSTQGTNRVLIFLFFPCQSDEIDGEGGAVGEFGAHNSKEVEILKTSRGKDLLALDGYVFYRNSQVRLRGDLR